MNASGADLDYLLQIVSELLQQFVFPLNSFPPCFPWFASSEASIRTGFHLICILCYPPIFQSTYADINRFHVCPSAKTLIDPKMWILLSRHFKARSLVQYWELTGFENSWIFSPMRPDRWNLNFIFKFYKM